MIGVMAARRRGGRPRRALARGRGAGAAFGIAMLCRETTALPLVGSVPIFLLGKPVPRRVLIASGVGFAAVIGGEALFQYCDDRRSAAPLHHRLPPRRAYRSCRQYGGQFPAVAADRPAAGAVGQRRFRFAVLAGGCGALARRAARPSMRRAKGGSSVLAAMAAASFVLVALLVHKLVLNPRYFTLARAGRGDGRCDLARSRDGRASGSSLLVPRSSAATCC